MDFTNPIYLQLGNSRQQRAFKELSESKVLEVLKDYKPVLVGTIPIDIDVEGSDLDIICEFKNQTTFYDFLKRSFGSREDFEIKVVERTGVKTVICRFSTASFPIEIFGQPLPVTEQLAYRHMLIEYKILNEQEASFKTQIRELKHKGLKTEPAFAQLLKLKGDPYKALLELE